MRWESLPSLPTTRLTRASSAASVLVGGDDLVQRVGDLAGQPDPIGGHADAEITAADV